MDAMKAALLKKMQELKMGSPEHGMKIDISMLGSKDDEEDEEKHPDMAPSVEDGDAMLEEGIGDSDELPEDLKMQALKGIADSSHTGRESMGLHERAAKGAKLKLAQMLKK